MSVKLIIDPEISKNFPKVKVVDLQLLNINNCNINNEISILLSGEESRVRAQFQKETFTEHPQIQAWREIYSKFGVKPKEAKSSIENLYRLILSGRDLHRISPLVDLYNYISIKYMLPVGSEDLDKVKGEIHLTFATDAEPAVQLLGDEQPESPKKGEVIYKDDISAICRRWNWREADRTKLTPETKNAIVVFEDALGQDDVINSAVTEMKDLASRFLI